MKKDCTTCKHAVFKTTASGRRNLDNGKCIAQVILPNSFMSRFHYGELPSRETISKYTKPDCPLWEKEKT